MECGNCELRQRQFYCENCLKQHLLSYRLQIGHATSERDDKVDAAKRSLVTVIEPPRLRRADLRATEERVREIWDALELVRKANETTRERIQSKRDLLAGRRRTLAAATSPDISSYTSSTSSSPSPGTAPASSPSARPFLAHANRNASASSSRPSSSAAVGTNTVTSRLTQITRSASASAAPSTPKVGSPPGAYPPSPTPEHDRYKDRDRDRENRERDVDAVLVRQIDEAHHQLGQLAHTIARARAGLVLELVEVFSVVEVGGRPPLGGKAGTRGEWTIGGLVLPVPGDMRRYPPDHINAVLTHTLHFLFLLAFYLGVKLPFEVVWSRSSTPPSPSSSSSSSNPPSGFPLSAQQVKWREAERPNGLLGVGTPWIGAVRGGESGGWARWSTKHPLHVSARESSVNTGSAANTETNPTAHARTASSPSIRRASSHAVDPAPPNMDDSQLDDMPQGDIPGLSRASTGAGTGTSATTTSAFTTALAMLLYNVCFLAHTQGVDVPLAQAGEALGNLWAVCCSGELGRKSHATHTQPRLPAPTPPTFPLDFAQLLQATAANPSRARARGGPGREVSARHKGRERDRIAEEEEWELIEDM